MKYAACLYKSSQSCPCCELESYSYVSRPLPLNEGDWRQRVYHCDSCKLTWCREELSNHAFFNTQNSQECFDLLKIELRDKEFDNPAEDTDGGKTD